MQRLILFFSLVLGASCTGQSDTNSNSTEVKLNQIQLIGSHNSYKMDVEPALLERIRKSNPEAATSVDYSHLPIWKQFDLGLLVLELDVYHDPEGGRFSRPLGLEQLRVAGIPTLPFDEEAKLSIPGFKVFHVQDLDFRSHFLLFSDYLEELKNWSMLNPNHLPVFITINAKDENYPELGLTEALDFDASAFKALNDTIKRVFGSEKLLMPTNIKNGYENLETAVTQGGWPPLESTREKFVFVLDETGAKMEQYLLNDPQLDHSVLFVNKGEGDPLAAIRIINDPIENHEYIQKLVKQGYLVRTRADADTREARENTTERREMAFSSGAQLISTDYYLPDSTISSAYKVEFEGGSYQRFNPVFDKEWPTNGRLEEGFQKVLPLGPTEFTLADKKMDNLLLDVRTQEEVDEGTLPHAEHIDFLKDDFEDKVLLLDKEKPILVYCKVGGRSAKASELLLELGFKKVYHLSGGIDVWKERGFPIVK